MKNFNRKNKYLSLCGLNCQLCPMNLSGHCGGCGFGNQSCSIARCSLEHGNPEYCFECEEYPCRRYEEIDAFDSFITHRNQKSDLEKGRQDMDSYIAEQKEKREILNHLLTDYNDGRKKTLLCNRKRLAEDRGRDHERRFGKPGEETVKNDLYELTRKRRSVRRYGSAHIDDDTIHEIMKVTKFADILTVDQLAISDCFSEGAFI